MSSLQSLDIALRSATTTPAPQARRPPALAKLIDVSTCTGCKACQVACMQWNDLRDEVGTATGGYGNPPDLSAQSWTVLRYSEVELEANKLEWLIRKDGCLHCADPGCLKACPAPGAIVKYGNGIVDFISEHCIGCGYCIAACPFDVPRLSSADRKAYKCSLCSDRVAVGLEPACVKACPTGALQFGSKEDMHDYAATRIVDLQQRGFAKAGVYDPPGVGGTHVLYVLQHADRWASTTACRPTRRSARSSRCGRALPSRWRCSPSPRRRSAPFSAVRGTAQWSRLPMTLPSIRRPAASKAMSRCRPCCPRPRRLTRQRRHRPTFGPQRPPRQTFARRPPPTFVLRCR